MQEISPAHRADLTLCKKSGDRYRSEALLHDRAVVMSVAKEAFSAAAAAEQKGAEGGMAMLGAIGGEQDMKVVAGRFGVPELELNRLAFLYEIADRDGAGSLVGTDQVAHQEIAALESAAVLIDGNADVQGAMCVTTTGVFQRVEDFLETSQRRFASKLEHHVLFGPRDDVPLANRAATLRDDGPDGDRPRELYANKTPVEDRTVL